MPKQKIIIYIHIPIKYINLTDSLTLVNTSILWYKSKIPQRFRENTNENYKYNKVAETFKLLKFEI